MPASSHAAAAARHLLLGLAHQGVYVESVDEAVTQGYVTDLQWCAVLDEFRERYGVRSGAQSEDADLFPARAHVRPGLPKRRRVA